MPTPRDYDLEQVVSSLLLARGATDSEQAKQHVDKAITSVLPGGTVPEQSREPKAVGDLAPEFTLPGAGPDGIDRFRLTDYTDAGAVVLVFYPFDFSPVCTTQLCRLRDTEWLTFTDDVDVFGVSVDSAYCHKQFRELHDLGFPLLSDRLASVAHRFGVKYDEWEYHPAIAKRAIFAIDSDDVIRYRWVADDATTNPSADQLEAALAWLA